MKILQQAQEMQGKVQQVQAELEQMTVTGAAGGGLVTAEVNGTGAVRRVKIDPSVSIRPTSRCWRIWSWWRLRRRRRRRRRRPRSAWEALTGGLQLPFKLPF